MWTSEISSTVFFAANRWTVSYFTDTGDAAASSFKMRPLCEVAFERKGAVDPQLLGEASIVYLGLENIRPLTGELVSFSARPASSIKSRSKVFQEGDVLYGRLRPELNKVFLPNGNAMEGLCSGEFIVLTPRTDVVLPRYLRHILASTFVTRYASKFTVGASLPRMATSDLLSIEIPVPPISVQNKLVEALEDFDAEIKSLRERLERLPEAVAEGLLIAISAGNSSIEV